MTGLKCLKGLRLDILFSVYDLPLFAIPTPCHLIYKNGIRRGYLETNSSLKEVHDEIMKVVAHEAKDKICSRFYQKW